MLHYEGTITNVRLCTKYHVCFNNLEDDHGEEWRRDVFEEVKYLLDFALKFLFVSLLGKSYMLYLYFLL